MGIRQALAQLIEDKLAEERIPYQRDRNQKGGGTIEIIIKLAVFHLDIIISQEVRIYAYFGINPNPYNIYCFDYTDPDYDTQLMQIIQRHRHLDNLAASSKGTPRTDRYGTISYRNITAITYDNLIVGFITIKDGKLYAMDQEGEPLAHQI